MIKKLMAIISICFAAWLLVPFPSAMAYPGGLMDGQPVFDTRDGKYHSEITDGNLDTYLGVLSNRLVYTFPEVVTISYLKTHAGRSSSTPVMRVYFYSEGGTLLGSKDITINAKQDYQVSIGINSVKRIEIANVRNFWIYIYEFDVFGAYAGSPPPAPTGLTASVKNGNVTLKWNPVEGFPDLAGYNVYKNGQKLNATPITSTSYVAEAKPNVTEMWQVTAIRETGAESERSDPAYTYYDTVPPPAPGNLRASVSGNVVTLSWNSVRASDLDGYYVYRNGTRIDELIQGTTYRYELTTPNVEETVYVTAVDTSGNESKISNTVTVVWDTIPPEKVNGLFATPKPGQILLEWIANRGDGTVGYFLYRDGSRVTPEPITSTSYLVNGVPGVEYEFRVSAVDQAGNEGPKSDPVRAAALVPPDTTPPAAPTGLTATGEVGRVKLTWNANSEPDLAGYIVYRNGVRLNQEPIRGTIYYVYGLSYGIGYEFQVSAVDQAGNESEKSNVAKAAAIKPEDTTPPATPTGLTAALGSDALHIALSWLPNSEPDLAGYNLYVSLDGLTWQKVNAEPITGTEYDFSPIEGNTSYYFRLSALDESGNESKPTKEVRIKTPSREVDPDVKKTPPKLIITWSPVPGAVQYLIYYQGRLYAVVPSSVTQYEITLADGYDPEAERQNVVVKARFLDGSIGEDPPDRTGQRWGFGPGDVFRNSMWLVGSVAGFVLFGIVIMYAPHLIRIIKDAAARRKGANV